MKIALVHKRLDFKGGTERDLYRTAQGLRDLGHEVHLFCSEYGVAPPTNVIAHRVPVIPLGRTARLWSFARFGLQSLAKANCEIVIGFGRLPQQNILRCGGGTHRGFLERMGRDGGLTRRVWHNVSFYHQSLLAIEKRQYDRLNSGKIVAVSQQVKRDIIAHYSVPPEKVVVLYNGVDLNRFHPSRRRTVRDQVRSRWKIPGDVPLVLFVGSGFQRKGLDCLLSMWRLPSLGRMFLLVVGADARLGRYRARAAAAAPGRVIFAGRQEDIENYYAAADVVALPAVQEAFGNVVLEALATGLPVLVSREVGAAELLTDGLSEGIVDPKSELEDLAKKLMALLEKSKDPCYMRLARDLAEQYSWESHFLKLEALLLEGHHRSAGANT